MVRNVLKEVWGKWASLPLVFCAFAMFAHPIEAAETRYQSYINGGATMFGNSWFESVTGYPNISVPDVDDGTVFDPWGWATTHSTYADLILPPGSTIEKAFLYVERAFASEYTSEVKLGVPSASGYITLDMASPGFVLRRLYSQGTQLIWD